VGQLWEVCSIGFPGELGNIGGDDDYSGHVVCVVFPCAQIGFMRWMKNLGTKTAASSRDENTTGSILLDLASWIFCGSFLADIISIF
jgi:hypothetical protein